MLSVWWNQIRLDKIIFFSFDKIYFRLSGEKINTESKYQYRDQHRNQYQYRDEHRNPNINIEISFMAADNLPGQLKPIVQQGIHLVFLHFTTKKTILNLTRSLKLILVYHWHGIHLTQNNLFCMCMWHLLLRQSNTFIVSW